MHSGVTEVSFVRFTLQGRVWILIPPTPEIQLSWVQWSGEVEAYTSERLQIKQNIAGYLQYVGSNLSWFIYFVSDKTAPGGP